jgi:hypothetical protein
LRFLIVKEKKYADLNDKLYRKKLEGNFLLMGGPSNSKNWAVPKLKRLVAGFPPRLTGFASGQHVGFVVDKAALGLFSEYFGFPCQSFHQFLHHHNHPGLAQ